MAVKPIALAGSSQPAKCHTLSRVLLISRTSMLSLSIRSPFTLFSRPTVVQTAFYTYSRKSREIAKATEPAHHDTDTINQPNDQGMGQITQILENAASSQSPSSSKFASRLLVASVGQPSLTHHP